MAQAMHCDYGGCEQLADVIVSQIANGDTAAWCAGHYVVLCAAVVAQSEGVTDAAEAAPAATPDPDTGDETDEDEAADVAILSRLRPDEASTSDEQVAADADELDRIAAATIPAQPFPAVAEVVKRGTSPSRRAHEARRRAKVRQPAETAEQP